MSFSITTTPATTPQARTLVDIFNATAVRCVTRVAIEAADATLTYHELADTALELAARLTALGVGPGDRVGVRVSSGTSELYVAILGVVQSGAAYVPVDADDPPTRAAVIFERAGACCVVRDGLAIDELATPSGVDRPVGVDDDAWVMFTSGTTGEPKGVAVSHRSAAAFIDAEARLWNVEHEDRVLAGLSVGFDASCEEIWLAWRHGAALVPAPRSIVRAGSELGPWLVQHGVSVVSTVPTLAAMWDECSLAGVRLLILGGEACPESLGWRLAAGREVWNTYGPTEATVVTTAARIHPGEPITIGRPLDGWKTAVVDDHGEPVQVGDPGELVIAGAGVPRYLDPVPLYASVYTRAWLRLAGIEIGRRTEISTAVGLNRLSRFGEMSFAADDVVLAGAKARGGWIYVAPIEVGDRSFLDNGAILEASTRLGHDSLVGVLTTAPRLSTDGTSWFGSPALELPRVPDRVDPSRTTNPPTQLILARGTTELIRILLPSTVSAVLAALVFWTLTAVSAFAGVLAMAAAAPVVITAAAVGATTVTIAIKWGLMGRYRPGEHPLWSFFVWRDEIVNTCQEQLAGAWLLGLVLGTPLMSLYLRLMGAHVGRDVWCETLTVTEFDLAELGDGCAVNRNAVVETHLFHDRLMRIGPASLAPGSTLGPAAAMLPDSTIEAGSSVGGRSVVMRGERLPSHTRWQGAPVVAV